MTFYRLFFHFAFRVIDLFIVLASGCGQTRINFLQLVNILNMLFYHTRLENIKMSRRFFRENSQIIAGILIPSNYIYL